MPKDATLNGDAPDSVAPQGPRARVSGMQAKLHQWAATDPGRARVSDKRVLALVKGFLKAGLLTELGEERDSPTGTPQGGILSPLLANIALSVLDEHLHAAWRDDVHGLPAQQGDGSMAGRGGEWSAMRTASLSSCTATGPTSRPYAKIAHVLEPIDLRLSGSKTKVVHMSDGFDFLGFHIQ